MTLQQIPTVTSAQMREVDRLMVEEIGITVPMMMENAGRNIAVLCRRLLGGSVVNKLIVILCGKGNNGGDGLAAGRHLVNFGARVEIYLSHFASELNINAKFQYQVLKRSRIPVFEWRTAEAIRLRKSLLKADYVLDGLLGYSVKGDPHEPIASLIKIANDSRKPILAIDLPSGLDPDRGIPSRPTIRARVTITLALPKT